MWRREILSIPSIIDDLLVYRSAKIADNIVMAAEEGDDDTMNREGDAGSGNSTPVPHYSFHRKLIEHRMHMYFIYLVCC